MPSQSISIQPVTFEHLPGALGIGTATPRLSWKTTAGPGWAQTGYQLAAVRGGVETLGEWTPSSESVLVAWPF
ncbi:hypothetical protein, partial [Sinomonas sp. G460-2]|uniref:glycoside hydrolase family 78 protein n=1 Tax=Sinomonas sp. G460-2 TaxID=3393464 RepID=UPI0039EEF7DF